MSSFLGVGCYSSSSLGNEDAGLDGRDGLSTDGQAFDGRGVDSEAFDTRNTPSDMDGSVVEGRLRHTFLLLRDWVIEERRLDDPSVVVDSQELPERLGASWVREDAGMVLVATEHGFLFAYHSHISPNLYVYDRRSGWSVHEQPVNQFIDQPIIRGGWLYPPYRTINDELYRFHIESGRFERHEQQPEHHSVFDGLDGRVRSLGTASTLLTTWDFNSDTERFDWAEEGGIFPYFGRLWGSIRLTATTEGALPFCLFGERGGGRMYDWAFLERDDDSVYRTTREARLPGAHGNIVPTANDEILFFSAADFQRGWEEREADITLYQMDTSFENLEVLLEGRFGWPVEIALGDPVERVVAATRSQP